GRVIRNHSRESNLALAVQQGKAQRSLQGLFYGRRRNPLRPIGAPEKFSNYCGLELRWIAAYGKGFFRPFHLNVLLVSGLGRLTPLSWRQSMLAWLLRILQKA